jgi:hypothetical protein
MLSQYKNPIALECVSWASLSDAETAINGVLSGNPGYCLAGSINTGIEYLVFDEDWGVPNPIHSVVLVELTAAVDTQLPTVLSGNPGYKLVDVRFFGGVPAWAFVLGSV